MRLFTPLTFDATIGTPHESACMIDVDIVSASYLDDKVIWHENIAGDGSKWLDHEITRSADGGRDCYAADIDSDGDVDIVSASRFDNKISISIIFVFSNPT